MTLAQRVRDCRYAKGWGPDELASRASISRTALYQIESGKTEQPRAATLRRIAEALSVSTDSLLGQSRGLGKVTVPWTGIDPEALAAHRAVDDREEDDAVRFGGLGHPAFLPGATWGVMSRERELSRKFAELLHSSLGEGLARIVEESHRLLPQAVEAVR